jgi:hypothetical protein
VVYRWKAARWRRRREVADAVRGTLMTPMWVRVTAIAGLVCVALTLSGCPPPVRGTGSTGQEPTGTTSSGEVTTAPDTGTGTGAAELVTVPDVLGKYYDEAAKILTDAGLEPVDVPIHGPIEEDAGEIGLTYRQTPNAGEQVAPGTKVELRSWWESQ